ncbi:MAG: LamG-like jellyroll fold domain-containing protein [Thermodesulfobacteriota bacterium]|nr:LamG-like jellyroll fold domain-containing protein [Thermodesulfobacteriota bacterium]
MPAATAGGYATPSSVSVATALKLLLHCDGADESTTFTDKSSSVHGNATAGGNAQVDTAVTDPWSGNDGVLMLDGTGDYLSYADHADWDISTNWTLDLWVKHNTGEPGAEESYVCQYEDDSNCWSLMRGSNESVNFYVWSGGTAIISLGTGIDAITDTNWHHVAVCKVGNEYGLYIDGTQVAYLSDSDTDTFAGTLYVGYQGAGAGTLDMDGYIADVRIRRDNHFGAAPVVGLTDTISIPTVPVGGVFLNLANSIDDNTGTYADAEYVEDFIVFDLGGSNKLISGLRIYWGADSNYRPTDYDLDYSLDAADWTQIENYTSDPGDGWEEYDFAPKYCRYIRLQINTHGASGTRVYEVDYYSEVVEEYFLTHFHNILNIT